MNEGSQQSYQTRLERHARAVEALLDTLLAGQPLPGELARPATLLAAMRHGVLNGGKRLRPFLLIESAALFETPSDAVPVGAQSDAALSGTQSDAALPGAQSDAVLRVAASLECVHCYSLVHDDLPAMDDDDLRRGQPTVHKAFDEATAILAGDALLTYAFDVIAAPETQLPDDRRLALMLALARASGIGGMAGGQALDLAAEQQRPDEAGIMQLQAMKTGALIRFACESGAIAGGAGAADRDRLARFGSVIGLAFQLADDLLDLTADAAALGKATGKDAGRGKATLAALHGIDWSRRRLDELVSEATQLLEPFGERAGALRWAAAFVANRSH